MIVSFFPLVSFSFSFRRLSLVLFLQNSCQRVWNLLDFTLAADKWRIRIHLEHLLWQGAVGALVCRSAHDDGQVEELANLGMGHDILLVQGRVPVASDMVETNLQVKNEKQLSGVLVRHPATGADGYSQSCSCRCAPTEQLGLVSGCIPLHS